MLSMARLKISISYKSERNGGNQSQVFRQVPQVAVSFRHTSATARVRLLRKPSFYDGVTSQLCTTAPRYTWTRRRGPLLGSLNYIK
jgi:hypothetical protein